MKLGKVKIGSFLKRIKNIVLIQDNILYKRITIRTKHQGILLRDELKGLSIGTKSQFIVNTGHFLLSKIDARLGSFGIVPEELDQGVITGNFWAYEVDKKKVNIEWFNLFTSSGNFYEICNAASSGTTHRKYLDEKKFLNFEINIPPLNEQEAFLNLFKEQKIRIDSISLEFKHQSNLVSKLRQRILKEAVQGKLVSQNINDESATVLLKKIKKEKAKLIAEGKLKKEKELSPISKEEIQFELPKGWIWCRLGEISIISRGSSPRPKGDNRYFAKIETKYNWITISDITSYCTNNILYKTREFLTEEGTKMSRYAGKDEFLIAVSGSTTGKCCITGIEGFFYDGIASIKFPNKAVTNKYLLIYIQQYYRHINTSVEGLFPNINTDFLKNLLFVLPSFSEQLRIVAKVEELMKIFDTLEKEIDTHKEKVKALTQALLREAFEDKKQKPKNEKMLEESL